MCGQSKKEKKTYNLYIWTTSTHNPYTMYDSIIAWKEDEPEGRSSEGYPSQGKQRSSLLTVRYYNSIRSSYNPPSQKKVNRPGQVFSLSVKYDLFNMREWFSKEKQISWWCFCFSLDVASQLATIPAIPQILLQHVELVWQCAKLFTTSYPRHISKVHPLWWTTTTTSLGMPSTPTICFPPGVFHVTKSR